VATLDQALVRAQLALELGRRDTAALLLTRVREVQQQKGLTAEVLPSIEARRQRVCERWSVGAPAAAAPGPC
jgi:phage shock protein A